MMFKRELNYSVQNGSGRRTTRALYFYFTIMFIMGGGEGRVVANGTDKVTQFLSREARIAGGQPAKVDDVPSRVKFLLLGDNQPKNGGGTILSNYWILSAAHNFPLDDDHYYRMYAGANAFLTGGVFQERELQHTDVHVHECYKEENGLLINDIALVYLGDNPLEFNDHVKPMCLPYYQSNLDLTGKTVRAAGWGATVEGRQPETYLRVAELKVISKADCLTRVKDTVHRTIINSQMCTFDPPRDTCGGDSGTTVDYKDPDNGDKYFAVGVTSYGEFCASPSYPAVYTRITEYLKWIEDTTKKVGHPVTNLC